MKCRSLRQDPITNKQNIIWFGSYGKNTNYELVTFPEGYTQDLFDQQKSNYYEITEIRPNKSKIWGEKALICRNTLLCSDSLILNSGSTPKYFKQVGTTYVPVLEMPKDWADNWSQYLIIYFNKTQDVLWNSSKQYYITGNKLSAPNYAEKQQGVRDSLIQRLSVIKGELWYKASYGLPLTEKIKNKGIYDSIIINIITEHPDVVNLVYYNSQLLNRTYVFDFIVYTIYNEEVEVRYTI